MTRRKVDRVGGRASISLPSNQLTFIAKNPLFNLSRFVQIKLNEYINFVSDVERLEKQLQINKKEVIL